MIIARRKLSAVYNRLTTEYLFYKHMQQASYVERGFKSSRRALNQWKHLVITPNAWTGLY